MSRSLMMAASITTILLAYTPTQARACGLGAHSGHTSTTHTSSSTHAGHDMHQNTEADFTNISLCAGYSHMSMKGLRRGHDKLSFNDAANLGYDMVPTKMDMDMVMFGVGVKPYEWLDLSLSSHFMRSQMFMIHDPLTTPHVSQHRTGGLGDTVVGGKVKAYESGHNTIHASFGLSLPTGSIDEGGVHGNPAIHSPYRMQLGTGTYDLLPSVDFNSSLGALSYGAGLGGRIHLGENDNGYSWGDSVNANIHGAYPLKSWLSVSAGATIDHSGKINGRDAAITQDMPSGNPDYYGGTVVTTSAGFHIMMPGENDDAHALSFSVGVPVYQDYNGIQMDRDVNFSIGWNTQF